MASSMLSGDMVAEKFDRRNFCDYTMFSRYILRDGWIFDGDKRVCWVPISLRPRLDDDFRGIKDGVVMRVVSTNRVVILQFNEMPF
jgi:hypothetical protein